MYHSCGVSVCHKLYQFGTCHGSDLVKVITAVAAAEKEAIQITWVRETLKRMMGGASINIQIDLEFPEMGDTQQIPKNGWFTMETSSING